MDETAKPKIAKPRRRKTPARKAAAKSVAAKPAAVTSAKPTAGTANTPAKRARPRPPARKGGQKPGPFGAGLLVNPDLSIPTLPQTITDWFDARGWAPRPHQMALLAEAQAGRSGLLIAPTGAGKTLSGFLPSIVDLMGDERPEPKGAGLHTIYVSPLKALAVDIARNLTTPVEEMALDITIETRSGDTSVAKRQRQRKRPPDILLTTPEQIALLLSHQDAPFLFADLKHIVLDELHSLVASKRGDLL
ncbi:MAG: DEAD/DEAH box helicase, partial [Pseudomonadota bacterium]